LNWRELDLVTRVPRRRPITKITHKNRLKIPEKSLRRPEKFPSQKRPTARPSREPRAGARTGPETGHNPPKPAHFITPQDLNQGGRLGLPIMLMPEVALELAEAVLVPLPSDLRVALGGLVQHVPAIFPELLENC